METEEILSNSNSKKRRIMIITGDDSIIEQIQKSSKSSLIKSIIIETKESNHDDELSFSSLDNETQFSNPKKIRNSTLTCVVCGSPALGYNFDAITCESCKAFFRRNALKNPTTFQCRRKGGCEITFETRRRCSACRLSKCLRSGMKRDRLQTTEEKAAKRRQIEENRTLTLQTHHDINDGKSPLLSPTFFDKLSTSPSDDTDFLHLTNFTDILPQQSRQLLSSEDLQRVETIRISYQQRIELAARDGLPWNPTVHSTTFLQHLNSRSVPAMRLLTFFRQIPEFNQLNVDDKVTLIKYNLMPLVMLNGTLSYNTETNQVLETDSDVPWDTNLLQRFHGSETIAQLKKIFNSFVRIAQYDQRIIQLAMIALILTKGFSTDADANEPMLNDSLAVYTAQNFYTELLWKYMETVHGSENSVRIFNELVAHFVTWITLEKELRLNLRNRLSPTDTNELLPIMKSLLHIA